MLDLNDIIYFQDCMELKTSVNKYSINTSQKDPQKTTSEEGQRKIREEPLNRPISTDPGGLNICPSGQLSATCRSSVVHLLSKKSWPKNGKAEGPDDMVEQKHWKCILKHPRRLFTCCSWGSGKKTKCQQNGRRHTSSSFQQLDIWICLKLQGNKIDAHLWWSLEYNSAEET